MAQLTETQLRQGAQLARIFIDAVAEAGPQGAPGGVMYAAVMGSMSLSQFQTIMATLCEVGMLRRRGECYFTAGN